MRIWIDGFPCIVFDGSDIDIYLARITGGRPHSGQWRDEDIPAPGDETRAFRLWSAGYRP